MKELYLLNFLVSKKLKLNDFKKTFSTIEKTSIPKFPINGEYLKNKGVKEGAIMGKILILLKNIWVNNNFTISDQEILRAINNQK